MSPFLEQRIVRRAENRVPFPHDALSTLLSRAGEDGWHGGIEEEQAERNPSQPVWHAAHVDHVLERLGTDQAGLSSVEARRRLSQHGRNVLPEPRRRSVLAVVFGQLRSPLIYLLLGAAVVSLWLGQFDDAAFILLVLSINTAIGAVQEWRAESNTAALRSVIRTAARVLRDGVLRRVDGAEIVPGDVLHLEAGERVPADLRLLKAADLQTDEASLTGESLPVDKHAGGLCRTTLRSATASRCSLPEPRCGEAGARPWSSRPGAPPNSAAWRWSWTHPPPNRL